MKISLSISLNKAAKKQARRSPLLEQLDYMAAVNNNEAVNPMLEMTLTVKNCQENYDLLEKHGWAWHVSKEDTVKMDVCFSEVSDFVHATDVLIPPN